MEKFIVMSASAPVKGKARKFGRYYRVAVVEITEDWARHGMRPAMISERARGVVRIVKDYGSHNCGKTVKSAFYRTMKEAKEYAKKLNSQSEFLFEKAA